MDPESFDEWVKKANSSTPGDEDIQREITEYQNNPDIINIMISLIESGKLSQSAIFFAFMFIIRFNDQPTEETISNLRRFIIEFSNSSTELLINSNLIVPLAKTFMLAFEGAEADGAHFLQQLSSQNDFTRILFLKMAGILFEENKTIDGLTFLLQPLIEMSFQMGPPEIIEAATEGLSKAIKMMKQGISPKIPFNVVGQIFDMDGPTILCQMLRNEKLCNHALAILESIVLSPPTSFSSPDVRGQFIVIVCDELSQIISSDIAQYDNIHSYVSICKALLSSISQISITYIEETIALISSFQHLTEFILRPSSMSSNPHMAEEVLSFWIADYSLSVESKKTQLDAKKKIRTYLVNHFFSEEIPGEIIEVLCDTSSNFIDYFVELLSSAATPTDEEIKAGNNGIFSRAIKNAQNMFQTSISNHNAISANYSLQFISKSMNARRIPKELIDFTAIVASALEQFPMINAESPPEIIGLELALLNFFKVLADALFKETDLERQDFLREEKPMITSFFVRFISELQGEGACEELLPVMMDILDFSRYQETPLQIIADNEEFFDLILSVDFFLTETSGNARKTRLFFQSIFALGYSMDNPIIVDSMLSIINERFRSDPTELVAYFMLSGASLAKNCKFFHFVNFIKENIAELLLNVTNNPDTPLKTIHAIQRFLVSISMDSSGHRLDCMSESAIFLFGLIIDVTRSINSKLEEMDHTEPVFFQLMSRSFQIVGNLASWPHVNIGVLEHYEDKRFSELLDEVLTHFLTVTIDNILKYPKFVYKYARFMNNLLDHFSEGFFKLDMPIIHHQFELVKSILMIDNEDSVACASETISVFIKKLPKSDDFAYLDRPLEECEKRLIEILFIAAKPIQSVAQALLRFSSDGRLLAVIDGLFGQIPESLRDRAAIEMKNIKMYAASNPDVPGNAIRFLQSSQSLVRFAKRYSIEFTLEGIY